MRVLHITDTFLPKVGGAELAIDGLVRAMNAAGQECALLAQRNSHVHNGELGLEYPLTWFGRPRASAWSGWSIQRHLRAVERERGPFDVLIGHHAFPPGYAAVKHARRAGRPCIVYPRGGDVHLTSRLRSKPAAWRKVCWTLREASAVVCGGATMEKLLRQIVGDAAMDGRLTIIPNGVDMADLRRDASGSRFADDPRFSGPFILGLGRMVRRKGFDLLIDAFAALKSDDWKLVMAGEGREEEALRRRAAPYGGRIVFTGLVTGADKRWLLQHCRFMAAPSREESFGNVALEAMACGKPVIGARGTGFADLVCDGRNGRLVNIARPGELRAALADYQGACLRAESTHALATAQAYSWEMVARRYADLLAKITERLGSQRSCTHTHVDSVHSYAQVLEQ